MAVSPESVLPGVSSVPPVPDMSEIWPRHLQVTLNRPFHPPRFFALVLQQLPTTDQDSAFSSWLGNGSVPQWMGGGFSWRQCQRMRSRTLWLASQHKAAFDLRFAGSSLVVAEAQGGWGTTGEPRIFTLHLSLLGTAADVDTVRRALEDCLLTDEEFAAYCAKHNSSSFGP
mmetsp:Transcript_6113/g.17863  ORF Transcript_6113/g.17863 Transcript_6113/m.17863 type:complete len:171 (-) Transcript_6113:127-639(-)